MNIPLGTEQKSLVQVLGNVQLGNATTVVGVTLFSEAVRPEGLVYVLCSMSFTTTASFTVP